MKTTHTSGQLGRLLELLEDKGMTPERFQAVQESGIVADLFHPDATLSLETRLKVQEMLEIPPSKAYIEVDYNLTFYQMAAKAGIDVIDGQYHKKSISGPNEGGFDTDTVKGVGIRKIEIKFLYIEDNISLKEVDAKLKREKLHPAQIEDLLAVQIRFPYLGRKYHLGVTGTYFNVADSKGMNRSKPVIETCRDRDGELELYLNQSHRVVDEYIIGISRTFRSS